MLSRGTVPTGYAWVAACIPERTALQRPGGPAGPQGHHSREKPAMLTPQAVPDLTAVSALPRRESYSASLEFSGQVPVR